ncbi:hypothetical protein BV372_30640 [Nostoc sp. T09]|uniref:hypothetical protein n=1 Tax=Nostoc sp. T09 TaxID=1932621 RepID=UPI000A37DCFC|nr:hypothetical protein [Nostoc sp. T09]OUL22342.1 hypothetical protein BV372_30640 [Nostoc sp. T09]
MSNANSADSTSNKKGKNMEIQKQFSFVGNLKKLHEKDEYPIVNFTGIIHCYKNGSVFIEIDATTNENLNNKKFSESVPVYKVKISTNVKEDKAFEDLFFFQLDELEKDLVQSPYEGDYIIEGKSFEEWSIKANIADANFTVTFRNSDTQESAEVNTQKHLVRLSNLHIDYNPKFIKGETLEHIYGISNLEVLYNFSTPFLDNKYEFSLISTSIGNKDAEILSAEMILKVIDKNNVDEEIPYNTYFAWFELLISFATGKCIKEIYSIETSQSISGQKKVEFWTGNNIFIKGRGITVIQQPHLHLFIKQCAFA